MGQLRIRQHVNPLSRRYQLPVEIPNFHEIYQDINQPLHLDIGCGRGKFIWNFAHLENNWNFLGLEIREQLVKEANGWCAEEQIKNLHYLFCNANIDLDKILAKFPPNILQRVTILFPDPWFKTKHHRRRVVQPELVNTLAKYLIVGGKVFVHSDVLSIATEICDRLSENPHFQRQYGTDWLTENLMPLASERENSTLSRGEPVYRAVFERIAVS